MTGNPSPVARIFNLVKLEHKEISAIYFYATMNGLILLAIPVGIQALIGFAQTNTASASIVVLIVLIVTSVFIAGVLQIKQMQLTEKIQQKIFVRYTFNMAQILPALKLSGVDQYYLPELINRFFDIGNLQKGLSKLLHDFPLAIIQIVFGLLLLAFYHPVFIAFGLLLLLVIWSILYYSGTKGLQKSIEESTHKYKAAGWLEEMARIVKSVKFSKSPDFFWVQAYLVYNIYNNVIEINEKRVGMVTTAYKLGERPAIDTTEVIAQLQNFKYQQNEALLALQNAIVLLNTFLWKQNNESYDLPEDILPDKKTEQLFDAVIFPELEKIIADAKTSHPELNIYGYKLNALTIERKLKFQELLPKADLKYNQLGKGYNIASTATKTLFDNNYRFGINFSVPLRLSQGRGEYKLAKLKIAETQLQQSQKEIDIINKVKKYYNQLVNYKAQVNLLQKTYNNYLQLQRGEETRFFNGESSLFLVNSRENKTLETMIKLIETIVKYKKTALGLKWATGNLWKV
jgi:hypothetical protein